MKQFSHYSPLPIGDACLTQPAKLQAYAKKPAGQGLFFSKNTGQAANASGQLLPGVFLPQMLMARYCGSLLQPAYKSIFIKKH